MCVFTSRGKMLTFKQFIFEDQKTDDWVNQYTDKDSKRIYNTAAYLFHRGLRKDAKYKYSGTNYGSKDLGGLTKRTIGVVVTDPQGKEHELSAKPSIERNKIYQKRIKKIK